MSSDSPVLTKCVARHGHADPDYKLRLLPQHGETADRVPKRTAHEDIRQKVGRQGKSRKSNQRGHAVRSVWNPAVISIAAGEDSGNRERRDGVTRGETSESSQT